MAFKTVLCILHIRRKSSYSTLSLPGTHGDGGAPGAVAVGTASLLTCCSLTLFSCLSENQCQSPSSLQHLPPSLYKICLQLCVPALPCLTAVWRCRFRPFGLILPSSGASCALHYSCCHCLSGFVSICKSYLSSYKAYLLYKNLKQVTVLFCDSPLLVLSLVAIMKHTFWSLVRVLLCTVCWVFQ